MQTKTEVLISGGGIPGLTLALLLAGRGIAVTVIEPSPPPATPQKPSGRTAAIMGQGLATLRTAGLEQDFFDEMGEDLQAIRIIDTGQGASEGKDILFPSSELDLPRYGVNVPLLPLHQALARKVSAHKAIRLIEKDRIVALAEEPYHIVATLNGGEEITASLLVSADGRQSPTRQMAGIAVWQRQYDQAALTCLLSHDKDHGRVSTEFHYTGGPFTLVPYKGRTSALVWVDERQRLEAHLRSPRQDLEDTMTERSQGLLGRLKMESVADIWPLMALRARNLTAHRQVLMAEAAHVLSPIGAQGLNLSLRDAAALDEALAAALSRGLDLGGNDTLKAYDKARRLDVLLRVQGVDHLHTSVATPDFLTRLARRGVMGAISGMPVLRHLLMRHGLGQAA